MRSNTSDGAPNFGHVLEDDFVIRAIKGRQRLFSDDRGVRRDVILRHLFPRSRKL